MIASDQFAHEDFTERHMADSLGETPAKNQAGIDTISAPIISLRYPLRSYSLPAQPESLIGRDDLVAKLSRLLGTSSVRLLSLVGPGGVGKTRLACEVAQHCAEAYASVCFIDLGQLTSSASFEAIVRDAITPRWLGGQTGTMSRRGNLIVLDNFEHVIDAAPVVAKLLTELPWLHVIVTSRTPLRIRWEHSFAVPPLRLPPDNASLDIHELVALPSVALFTAFVRQHHPDFEVTSDNAAIVAEICRRMDGLPLALELAAADLRTMPLERLLERTDNPLDALVHGPRDLPKRQQTMRSTIGWSYALLMPDERQIADRLAVFAGSASISAVAEVLDISTEAAYESLSGIADQSLIEIVDTSTGPRFRMWHIVHEFLLEQFETDDQRDALRERFIACYRNLVRETIAAATSTLSDEAYQTLLAEIDNIRAVLKLASLPDHRQAIVEFGCELVPFWSCSHQLSEGRRWMRQLIGLLDGSEGDLPATARLAAGKLAVLSGDARAALELLTEAQSASPTDATETQATIASWLCYTHLLRGDVASADRVLAAVPDRLDDEQSTGGALDARWLRVMIAVERDDASAGQLLADALQHADLSRDHSRASGLLCMQAELARAAGDVRTATRLFAEALVRAQVSHNPRSRVPALIGLGDIANDTLTIDAALHHYREALDIANAYGDDHAIVRALERIALFGTTLRVTQEWIGILGLAETMRRRLELGRSRLDDQQLRPRIRHARELLGSDDFERMVAEGEGLTLDAILATLETTPVGRQPSAPPAGRQRKLTSAAEMLTPREREVVQQISKGHTNRQIAGILGMSERTVDTHVSNIRQKLQLPSRARIAVWAVAQGLSNLD